jgi:hypothetical protein
MGGGGLPDGETAARHTLPRTFVQCMTFMAHQALLRRESKS